MQIIDDKIEFTPGDFDGFSDPVKKALSGYLEDYVTHFSDRMNALVDASRQQAKNLAAQDPAVSVVLESYANADASKRALAEPLLADLNALLKS